MSKMKFSAKIDSDGDPDDLHGNASWWNENPMTYDWEGEINDELGSPEFFSQADDNFGKAHALINNPQWPEGNILQEFIPYSSLAGKKVLEIGCGLGLVSSHMARAGAVLSSIDITENAVKLTKSRFKQTGLSADIRQMNAEALDYGDNEFDHVVSWGVIHHSSNMDAIIAEIHRVLKPGGTAHLMIYNKNSIRYQIFARIWHGIFLAKYLRMNTEQIVGSITDGYIARHLTGDEMRSACAAFSQVRIRFSDEPHTILKYLLGVAGYLRPFYPLTRRVQIFLAKRWGWYLEAEVIK